MKLNERHIQSKSNCFIRVFLMLTPLFLFTTSMIAIPSASAHELNNSTETIITNKFSAGQMLRVTVNGVIQMESDV